MLNIINYLLRADNIGETQSSILLSTKQRCGSQIAYFSINVIFAQRTGLEQSFVEEFSSYKYLASTQIWGINHILDHFEATKGLHMMSLLMTWHVIKRS